MLGWYGPYDAHEANSIAKASLAKVEDGALRFAFDCVFIEVFFRGATEASYENCSGDSSANPRDGDSKNQLDLSLIEDAARTR